MKSDSPRAAIGSNINDAYNFARAHHDRPAAAKVAEAWVGFCHSTDWMFGPISIRPTYYFQSNARIINAEKGSTVHTDDYCVSPVHLAFAETGVRWGRSDFNVVVSVTEEAKDAVQSLSRGDQDEIQGVMKPGPCGIVELQQVRSVKSSDESSQTVIPLSASTCC